MKKRLPDFSKSKLWEDLRSSMNIEKEYELPEIIIGRISLEDINQLRTASIDISNVKDFINPIDGTFEYKGQKVILYIKEQRYRDFMGVTTYKYHLSYCDTLDWMDNSGRFERYVVTQRTDGKFLVDVVDRMSGRYIQEDKLLLSSRLIAFFVSTPPNLFDIRLTLSFSSFFLWCPYSLIRFSILLLRFISIFK